MKANSKSVWSKQNGIHKNLHSIVEKHVIDNYRKPIQEHNQKAFEVFQNTCLTDKRPLILDSCCGTGMSSVNLARVYSDHWVVGLDQSKVRLDKTRALPSNLLLLQVNCEDFWRLCVWNNIQFERHYIFYANPWPKAHHIMRRWHGHPVFPFLILLSQSLELRANWKIYLDEFAFAWRLKTQQKFEVTEYVPENFMTLFEKKYFESGQTIYRLEIGKKALNRGLGDFVQGISFL